MDSERRSAQAERLEVAETLGATLVRDEKLKIVLQSLEALRQVAILCCLSPLLARDDRS